MSKCEVIMAESMNGKLYAKSYAGKSFEKSGLVWAIFKFAKGVYRIAMPGTGYYIEEYSGKEKDAPEHITAHLVDRVNALKSKNPGIFEDLNQKLCALCEVAEIPAPVLPDCMKENTPAPALDAKSETSEARPAADQETRTAEKPARKEEKPARNVIKRDSAMIIGSWKQETTAGAPGDKLTILKIDGSGFVGYNHRTLETYSFFASSLRNANFFEIEAQYPGKPYDYETGYNMIDGWIERAKENRREARAERAQVWKPCIMSPLRKYVIIYRDIIGATVRQKPASADRVKAVLRLQKMQWCINIGWTAEKPVTGAERSHNAKRAPGGYPPKRDGEKAGNRQETPQARKMPQVTVMGSPKNQGEKNTENVFF